MELILIGDEKHGTIDMQVNQVVVDLGKGIELLDGQQLRFVDNQYHLTGIVCQCGVREPDHDVF